MVSLMGVFDVVTDCSTVVDESISTSTHAVEISMVSRQDGSKTLVGEFDVLVLLLLLLIELTVDDVAVMLFGGKLIIGCKKLIFSAAKLFNTCLSVRFPIGIRVIGLADVLFDVEVAADAAAEAAPTGSNRFKAIGFREELVVVAVVD